LIDRLVGAYWMTRLPKAGNRAVTVTTEAPDRASAFRHADFFGAPLDRADPQVFNGIEGELRRQREQIELIASENIVSRAVLQAQGSVLTNKYAEGYPGRRYYGGCEYVDEVERLAQDRAKALFGCAFANVQPHSGAQANQAVFMALLTPGDTFLGMDLAAGGHLTHGSPANQSGKWFKPISYTVRREDCLIDYDQLAEVARRERPKLILGGASAYSRKIDFEGMRKIADEIGAWFMVDMAHYAGLVAGGAYPDPLPHAHVVTTTTHKTLRGPRGGMILSNDEEIGKKINSAVFPGLQGGPLEHVIAAKAVALGEALKPEFEAYAHQCVDNARALAAVLIERGLGVVSGGTDSHLMLVDLRPKGVTGKAAEIALERANITCNKNGVPFDDKPFTITSGVRLGSPAGTTRGFATAEFRRIGGLIADVVDGLAANNGEPDAVIEARVKQDVADLTGRFPIYG
jgi:glycine hydroxymethyltransferase